MAKDNGVHITRGMQEYIDQNNKYLSERGRYIHDVIKKWKFDTIAVHGLYTVRDAIEDYQGSIIEPIFMSTAQAFRDSDEMAADLAHSHNLPLICDSTIATPALLRPICHGADIVVQSATKSLTTSGFGVCGAVIARKNLVTNIDDDQLKTDFSLCVKYLQNRDFGPNLHPMQAVMTLNDMRTLRVKMDLMSRNTLKVARFLEKHPGIESVQYLGLPDHPLHELASKYMWLVDAEYDEQYGKPVNRYGHLMSFCVKGGVEKTRQFFDGLQRIWRATDLGRIKSIATIPAISTHQQQGDEGRALANIPPNMVRLCVGGEHPDDIISDLDQALHNTGKK